MKRLMSLSKMKKPRVYLAGQSNEYENNWKEELKKLNGFEFYDWEFDSDQTSPDTYFPADLKGIKSSDILIANPGVAPSEATWVEIGYFLANNTDNPGDRCQRLIIIWKDERMPERSLEFIKKAGIVVNTVEEAINELKNV